MSLIILTLLIAVLVGVAWGALAGRTPANHLPRLREIFYGL